MKTLRSTYRPKTEVCWQKLRRDKYQHEEVPPVPHLDVKKAEVRRVDHKLAEQIILKYEWLGTMAPTNHYYGIFFGLYCAGVTCVGVGNGVAGAHVNVQFNLDARELAILARGACVHWAPPMTNSKLVSWTCKLLSQQTRAKLIMAFADTDAGEIGTIYQACNWTYIGRSKNPGSRPDWISPKGRIYGYKNINDYLKVRGIGWKKGVNWLFELGWKQQIPNAKHRYVYVLDKKDKDLMRLIEGMRLPYPKRKSAPEAKTSVARGCHPREGGANPTPALSPKERKS